MTESSVTKEVFKILSPFSFSAMQMNGKKQIGYFPLPGNAEPQFGVD